MTFTNLDPKTALLVIDLQDGIVGLPHAHPTDDVVSKTSALVKAFRRHGLPVVLVNVAGSPPGRTDKGSGSGQAFPDGWTDLIPELDQQPEDIIVTKYARSAFSGTGLTEHLRDLGVTQVVIAGIATSSGVESTARHAHEHGFHVTLPVDAMTDPALASHEHSVSQTFPRIAETGTTDELLRLLERTRS
jgi:nicotinamidase-related amidase